uniref:Uncharacterized protein n=1 Tax=Candidatus Kentrum sp. FM TaxID=2126340 RepID=A0A450SF16_9GAMM|nr:MAG: hypothetical protein BECKFM1743A_GA0114220_100932 [Candidatus Kentron sp. FM]VFJ51951.1 MAG: hypothetical protein BECKFM1743C_GA0114222_101032 [Candidatus Kentron sp. FM]VFK08993.1 MAG: hypothetical protein BECKFM1743B_GA0114221_100907 [Candidatus Kentron sp. FM]
MSEPSDIKYLFGFARRQAHSEGRIFLLGERRLFGQIHDATTKNNEKRVHGNHGKKRTQRKEFSSFFFCVFAPLRL